MMPHIKYNMQVPKVSLYNDPSQFHA